MEPMPVDLEKSNPITGVNHEEMTVHRGLAELKLLKTKLNREIPNVKVVFAVTADREKAEDVTNALRTESGKLMSVIDMVHRYDAIKRAIVLSNATTKVNIGGKEMTVAEAIEKKGAYQEFISAIRSVLVANINGAERKLNEFNSSAESRAMALVTAHTTEKMSESDLEVYSAYINAHGGKILCVDGVKEPQDILADLTNEIDAINSEIDAALSVSNAITTITVEYPVGSLKL